MPFGFSPKRGRFVPSGKATSMENLNPSVNELLFERLFLAERIECHQGRSKSRDNACGKNHTQIHWSLLKGRLMALVEFPEIPDVTTRLRDACSVWLRS